MPEELCCHRKPEQTPTAGGKGNVDKHSRAWRLCVDAFSRVTKIKENKSANKQGLTGRYTDVFRPDTC